MKSTLDIISIVKAGGSVIINSSKSTLDICSIVKNASSNSQVIVKNASSKSTLDLVSIAKAANGKTVIFDLTE
ncbi:MAG: hypothetical protein PHS78_06645 [Aliarcobacter skirrowii]|uniref:hypothetical protein n=1 Tax=Aliarcobacter skirrowii TaxID=28200 RepID=UPI00242F6996|nr:hypothetical protein [Aliarcobacter skirrowii]MDD2508700.1 hypothetical protein [Aliarcobacter skirrowii]MDD3496912.1 hypothetical protein [Aliarcobacter skirrowii]